MKQNLISVVCMLLLVSCQPAREKGKDVVATLDTTFVKRLFGTQKGELSGGDGAISIPLSEGTSLFLWGDSFIGEVKDNKRDTLSSLVFGNVFQTVGERGVKTYYGGDAEHPSSWLVADSIDGHRTALWPEHGFVKDGILHLFLANIVMYGSGTWDFYWHSLMYYRLSVVDFSVIDKRLITSEEVGGIHFGFAFMQEGDDIYTYGTKTVDAKTCLYLAKNQLVDGKLGSFSYYANGRWSTKPAEATALLGVKQNVSEQFSVIKHKGKYILLTQERGGNNIYSYIADALPGEWYNEKLVYTTPEPTKENGLFSYNAMAHHQYIQNDSLLFCYNVNTADMPSHYKDASIYLPRFLKVSLTDLMN